MVLTSAFTRNPTGKNQHKDCPPADDPRVRDALIAYHRRGLTDRKKISALLLSEHGIRLSESSIARRRRALNLHGSKYNSTHTAPEQIRALVEKYMTAEPTWGPRAIREAIIKDDGVLLTRDRIAAEMRAIDPDGFIERHPQMQKIRKQARGEGAEVEVDPEVV
ncbi:hypothetical protein PLICRDRAFT_103170 [Plicaturopsis crispa FD-325 SS-3]|nr:hypothetical protein PLICRDRAFT_103170 [Plicaturopsis crispa FD-325 SS-3]